jgi:hypothetical protein
MSRKPTPAKAPPPKPAPKPVPKQAPQPAARQTLSFRTDNLKSSYCNMCNATGTREEVVLNFGLNQNWDQPSAKPDVLEVDLQHRVVLSPFAAKRLSEALGKLMADYETRHGKLG